jgi:hypothetical protein
VNGLLEFGSEVIMWASGPSGAQRRMEAMQQDPEGYRRHLTRPHRPVTVQMAEEWRDHYRNEYERSRELVRARQIAGVNHTAAARAELMDRIAHLLREPSPSRPGWLDRLRDLVRRRDPGRRTMAGVLHPPEPGPASDAARERARPASRPPEPPTPGRLRHQAWVDEILRSGLEPGLPEIRFDPQVSLRRGTYRAEIATPEEAYQVYLEVLARSGAREVAIFRNIDSGRYAVEVGGKFDVPPPMSGNWEGVLHFHHGLNGKNILIFRMPAPADIRAALLESGAAGGVPRTEFVEYAIPGAGRGRVAYTVRHDLSSGTDHITIQYVRPDGQRVIREFSSMQDYETEWSSRTRHVDPVQDKDLYDWLRREIDRVLRSFR